MGFLDRLRGRSGIADASNADRSSRRTGSRYRRNDPQNRRRGGEICAVQLRELPSGPGSPETILVYACIREIATSAAEARLVAYRTDSAGAMVEVEGRIGALLRRPNEAMTQFGFLETIHQHLNIAGNAYFYKIRSLRGVNDIFILRPDRIRLMDDGSAQST